jgi:hypothetical protein
MKQMTYLSSSGPSIGYNYFYDGAEQREDCWRTVTSPGFVPESEETLPN